MTSSFAASSIAVCATLFAAAPAIAADENNSTRVFAESALRNDELALVTGMALRDRFFNDAKRFAYTDYVATQQQLSATSRIIFDNWFNDTAAPLIISNQLSSLR